jgi:hypothetical protein
LRDTLDASERLLRQSSFLSVDWLKEAEPISVAKGPKFRLQSSKRAEKNLVGPGKSGAELFPNLSKNLGLVFHKIIYISCQKLGL